MLDVACPGLALHIDDDAAWRKSKHMALLTLYRYRYIYTHSLGAQSELRRGGSDSPRSFDRGKNSRESRESDSI